MSKGICPRYQPGPSVYQGRRCPSGLCRRVSLDHVFYRGGRLKQWKDYFGEKELNQFMDMSEGALRLAGYL